MNHKVRKEERNDPKDDQLKESFVQKFFNNLKFLNF